MKKEPFGYQYYFVLLISLCTSMGYFMISSVIVKYIAGLGYSLTVAGLISGLYAAAALFMRPIGGMISDRFHEKKVLTIVSPIFALCIFGYGVAPGIYSFAIIRVISGFVFAVNSTVSTAYICKFIPRSRTGEGLGYMGLVYTISMAVSPGIGLAVYNSFGPKTAFYIAGCVIALAIIFIRLTKDDVSEAKKEAEKFTLSNFIAPSLLPLAFLNGLFSFCNGISSNFIILLAEERHISNPTIFFTVTAIAMLVVRPAAGKFNDTKGLKAILIPAYIISAIGMVFIAYLNTLPLLIVAAVLTALGNGSGQPSLQAECVRLMPPNRRGVAISTYFIFADVFQGCGPLIGGAITDFRGYSFTFNTCAAVMLGGLLLYILYNYLQKKKAGNLQTLNQ